MYICGEQATFSSLAVSKLIIQFSEKIHPHRLHVEHTAFQSAQREDFLQCFCFSLAFFCSNELASLTFESRQACCEAELLFTRVDSPIASLSQRSDIQSADGDDDNSSVVFHRSIAMEDDAVVLS